MTKTKAWWQFIKERFEPWSHMTMIVVFLMAHILVVNPVKTVFASSLNDLMCLIGVTAFYFKLRLFDEVKDYELDVVINKTRPLPRGLLTHRDMYNGMMTCILVELICFAIMGFQSLITISIAIIYSLFMYKEFFIPKLIRPYLTTYALVHTIVTTLLSFAIFSFLTQVSLWEILKDSTLISFAFANWLLFNIFEFGRKTFAAIEERDKIDTYSSLFGRTGAVMLVISQAAVTFYLALNLVGSNPKVLKWGLSLLLVALMALSINYIRNNSVKSARVYRTFSSLYIIIFYLIIIVAHIIP